MNEITTNKAVLHELAKRRAKRVNYETLCDELMHQFGGERLFIRAMYQWWHECPNANVKSRMMRDFLSIIRHGSEGKTTLDLTDIDDDQLKAIIASYAKQGTQEGQAEEGATGSPPAPEP